MTIEFRSLQFLGILLITSSVIGILKLDSTAPIKEYLLLMFFTIIGALLLSTTFYTIS